MSKKISVSRLAELSAMMMEVESKGGERGYIQSAFKPEVIDRLAKAVPSFVFNLPPKQGLTFGKIGFIPVSTVCDIIRQDAVFSDEVRRVAELVRKREEKEGKAEKKHNITWSLATTLKDTLHLIQHSVEIAGGKEKMEILVRP